MKSSRIFQWWVLWNIGHSLAFCLIYFPKWGVHCNFKYKQTHSGFGLKIKNLGASSVPAFFSEDDSQSNDSSDSDSSSSQSDDIEQETFMLDEPLERTTNSNEEHGPWSQLPKNLILALLFFSCVILREFPDLSATLFSHFLSSHNTA